MEGPWACSAPAQASPLGTSLLPRALSRPSLGVNPTCHTGLWLKPDPQVQLKALDPHTKLRAPRWTRAPITGGISATSHSLESRQGYRCF